MEIEYLTKLGYQEIFNIEELKTTIAKSIDPNSSEKKVIFSDDRETAKPDLRYFWDGNQFGLHISDNDFDSFGWKDLCDTIFLVTNRLKVLYIGRTKIESFNLRGSNIGQLEFLHLSENENLKLIKLSELNQLEVLNASHCPILETVLFDGRNRNLKKIDFSFDNKFIFDFIIELDFPNLEYLNLSETGISFSDKLALSKVPNLKYIFGVKDKLSQLDERAFDVNDLNVLRLPSLNQLKELEDEININLNISEKISLKESYKLDNKERINFLDLGHLNLTMLPKKMLEIKSIEHLCLGAYFPEKIGKGINWKKSFYYEKTGKNHNVFSSKELENLIDLPKLKSLYLNSINLDSLAFLNYQKQLMSLDISWNHKLSNFKQIKDLKNLTLFHGSSLKNFNDAQTEYLPENIVSLSLGNCEISDLKFLDKLPKAKYVYLDGNKVNTEGLMAFLFEENKKIKRENLLKVKANNFGFEGVHLLNNLIDEGLYAYLDIENIEQKENSFVFYFLKNIKEQEIQFKQIKLILLGNTRAGKTTLFDIFNLHQPNYKIKSNDASTHGLNIDSIEFLIKDTNQLDFLIKIYDFGGQDYYHSTHWPYFTTEGTHYLLVFRSDLIDEFNFFDSELVFPMAYWIESIKKMAMNNFLQNNQDDKRLKLDIFQNLYGIQSQDLNVKDLKDKHKNVLNIEIKNPFNFKEKLDVEDKIKYSDFKNDYINNLKQAVKYDTVLPKSRFDFIKQLKQNTKGILKKSTIKFKDKDKSWVESALSLAHNTYDIIYLNKPNLNEFVITDIAKLNEYIFKILVKDKEKDGYFKFIDAKERLEATKLLDAEIQYIINYMLEFEIVFKLEDDSYLAPAFLKKELTKSEELFVNTFEKPLIEYIFNGYYHSNIFTKIVIAFSKQNELVKDEGWKYVLKKGFVFLYDKQNDKNLLHIKFEEAKPENGLKPTIKVFNHSLFGVNEAYIDKIHQKLDELIGYNEYEIENIDKLVFNKYGEAIDFVKLKANGIINQENKLTNLIYYKDKLFRKGDFKVFLKEEDRKLMKMKKIFISYSKFDEKYKDEFKSHLITLKKQDLVETFDDRDIEIGDKFDPVIKQKIKDCDYFICLVSVNFLNVDYVINEEIPLAIKEGKKVIPIIIKPCDWYSMPFDENIKFGDLNAHNKANIITLRPEFRNKDGKGNIQIKEYSDTERDMLWLIVINDIRTLIESD